MSLKKIKHQLTASFPTQQLHHQLLKLTCFLSTVTVQDFSFLFPSWLSLLRAHLHG